MKKTFVVITSLILLCIMLIGCNSTDATITASKDLNKNLNILSNTVKRLDTVDNEYLVNNDLYTLETISNNVPTPTTTPRTRLANSYNVVIENTNEKTITDAITQEIINRLYCSEEGNCKLCNNKYICDENGVCTSCNQTIICDSNGNCNTCGDKLYLSDNKCSTCNSECVSQDPYNSPNNLTLKNLQKISDLNTTSNTGLLSLTNNNNNNNNEVDDNYLITVSDSTNKTNTLKNETIYTDSDNMPSQDTTTTQTNNNTTSNTEQNNQVKYYYYSEERFDPSLLRYKPRFISNLNFSSANSNLENYIEKLQKLYTMTADVVEANNTLASYKVIILDDINETRTLNDCIITGKCTPTSNQILALNNYIDDLKSTINNLRNCNGDLTSEINKISTRNTGLSHSIEVTNSNYLRILNQIDTRISYHENAIATLEQIKFLLQDAQNNINADTEIEDLNNTNNSPILNSDNNNIDITDDKVVEENETNNLADTNQSIEEDLDDSIIILPSDNQDNTDTITPDNNITTLLPEDNTESTTSSIIEDSTENSNSITNETSTNETENNLESSITTDIPNSNENNSDEIANLEEQDEDIKETYIDDESISNIDTYDNNLQSNIDTDTANDSENNTSNLTNDNIDKENESTFLNESETTNANTKPNSPQMVYSNDSTETIVNDQNNGYNNSENNSTNTIISQNNINGNDLGNNSYRYDDSGNLFNNTNGYNNNNINNINNKNNNVNTYEYNTLIDSINRGTINNGINNL